MAHDTGPSSIPQPDPDPESGFEDATIPSEGDQDETMAPRRTSASSGPAPISYSTKDDESAATPRPGGVAADPDASAPVALGRQIAKGGMGAVHEADDRKIGRKIAVKVMLPRVGGDAEQSLRFIREAEVLGRLEHPNIVPVHDLGRDASGRLYYSMKLVKGRTLQDIVKGLRREDPATLAEYTLDRLLIVFRKICDAIGFAHAEGIIHRDLKPENVMVGKFGEVLVMDWGLAKILDGSKEEVSDTGREDFGALPMNSSASATLEGAVMGTPQYMSPEQARGEVNDLDARSDVYSLGGILYAMLTLRPPVQGRSVREILANVQSGQLTAPSRTSTGGTAVGGVREPDAATAPQRLPHIAGGLVPGALSAVAMKALSLRREERYPDVNALDRDVEMWQRGFATSAEQAGLWKQLELLVKRHRRVFATAGIAMALIAVLAVWFVVNLQAKETRARQGEVAARTAEAKATASASAARAAEGVAITERKAAEAAEGTLRQTLTLSHFNRGVDLLESGDGPLGLAYLARALRTDTNHWPTAARISLALQQRPSPADVIGQFQYQSRPVGGFRPGPTADSFWVLDDRVCRLFSLRDTGTGEGFALLATNKFTQGEGFPASMRLLDELLRRGHPPERAASVKMPGKLQDFGINPAHPVAWTGDTAGNFWFWDLHACQPIQKLKLPLRKDDQAGGVFSHDGKYWCGWANDGAANGCRIELRDGVSGERLNGPFMVPKKRISSLRFARDDRTPRRLIATQVNDVMVFLIDPWKGEPASRTAAIARESTALPTRGVTEDGRRWWRLNPDGQLVFGSAGTNKADSVLEVEGFRTVAAVWDDTGSRIALVGTNSWRLYSVADGQTVSPLHSFADEPQRLRFEDGVGFVLTTSNRAGDRTHHCLDPDGPDEVLRNAVPGTATFLEEMPGDKSLRVWKDDASARLLVTDEHDRVLSVISADVPLNTIDRVRFSPEGARLAVFSGQKTVRLWDIISAAPISAPIRANERITGMFSADGTTFISNDKDDPFLQLWDAWTGAHLRAVSVPMARDGSSRGVPVMHLPGRDRLVLLDQRFIVGGRLATTTLSAIDIRATHGESRRIEPVAGGRNLVLARDGDAWVSRTDEAGAVVIHCGRFSRPDEVAHFELPDAPERMMLADRGDRLVTVHGWRRVRVWELPSGKLLRSLDFDEAVLVVEISPGGDRMFIVGEGIPGCCWATETNAADWPFDDSFIIASFSPDGETVGILTSNAVIQLRGAADGMLRREFPSPAGPDDGPATGLLVSPSADHVIELHQSKGLIIETASGRVITELQGALKDLVLAPAGDLMVIEEGVLNSTRLTVRQVKDGRSRFSPVALPWVSHTLGFAPGGDMLFADAMDRIELFDSASGRRLADPVLFPMGLETQLRPTPDGAMLATEGLGTGMVTLWALPLHEARSRVLSDRGGKVLRIDLPPREAAAPDWLPTLAEAVAGRRVNVRGSIETLPSESLTAVRNRVGDLVDDGFYPRLARWFFADPRARSTSPGAGDSTRESLRDRVRASGDPDELRELVRADPADGLTFAKLGCQLADTPGHYWLPPAVREPRERLQFLHVPKLAWSPVTPGRRSLLRRLLHWHDRQAELLSPEDAEVLNLRAELAERMDDLPAAERLTARALALAPEDPASLFRQARLRQASRGDGYGAFLQAIAGARGKGKESVLGNHFGSDRLDRAWWSSLNTNSLPGNDVAFRSIAARAEKEVSISVPRPDAANGIGRIPVMDAGREKAEMMFAFRVPVQSDRLISARLRLHAADAPVSGPMVVELVAKSDWQRLEMLGSNAPPGQGILGRWTPVPGRQYVPLDTDKLKGFALPGGDWFLRVRMELPTKDAFASFSGIMSPTSGLAPALELLIDRIRDYPQFTAAYPDDPRVRHLVELDRLLAPDTHHPAEEMERVRLLVQTGFIPEAMELLDEAAGKGVDASLIHGERGNLWAALDREREAFEEWGRAIRAGSRDADVFSATAQVWLGRGRLPAARKDAERAFTLRPCEASAKFLAQLLLAEGADKVDWSVLRPVEMRTKLGATLTLLDDASVLAGGENAELEEYHLILDTPLRTIAAIRLEALTHESLPRTGPGRSVRQGLGAFNVGYQFSPVAPDGRAGSVIPLGLPVADYSEAKYPISRQGWDVGQTASEPHVAYLPFAGPVSAPERVRLKAVLKGRWKDKNLGRFRLSATADPDAFEHERGRLEALKLENAWARLAASYRMLGDNAAAERVLASRPAVKTERQ